MQNKSLVIGSIIVLIAIFFGASYFYKDKKSTEAVALVENKSDMLKRSYSFVLGKEDAKVELVEFFDPACGTCAYFFKPVKNILNEHYGDVKLVLRYAPFHKNSDYAIKLLAGAKEQNMILEVLELMYATQNQWVENHVVNKEKLLKIISNIQDLDIKKLLDFANSLEAQKIIDQELKDIDELKITKTPSFFVNGKPLINFGLKNLQDMVESEVIKGM